MSIKEDLVSYVCLVWLVCQPSRRGGDGVGALYVGTNKVHPVVERKNVTGCAASRKWCCARVCIHHKPA